MARVADIPAPVIRRLSLYLRQLETLRDGGRRTVSSRQLAAGLKSTDAQVRKDLAHFGQFGQPGIGYRVEGLIRSLRHILGTDRNWNVCVVGAGNLGRALACYRGFARHGFTLVAAFDQDPAVVGHELGAGQRIRVQPMRELATTVRKLSIRLGIVAVPASEAQQVATQLVDAGVRGILNFAPVPLALPPETVVAAVDLSVPLEQLSFQLGRG